MGAKNHTFIMLLGVGCGSSEHVNASYGLGSDILQD